MNFRHGNREEPEINLIPFIDILLVVLIFLMLTTTFSQTTALQVNLPLANAETPAQPPAEIVVAVGPDGRYAVDDRLLEAHGVDTLVAALRSAQGARQGEPILVIQADAAASHQSVINVMDAARQVGLVQITFATQHGQGG
ncbi:Biopolymer transport protein ExbD [Tepidimonas thermarum]|uniref:Biopolymer transport protein ExbD n=1 Tax=Tepidimonas thermarum TaxID=335431 RepID=A0A554X0C4_9BURK|nr:biopolymer transporter ExbD [Tepidimonas thermarum]TSE29302.1 Biopolymer transport protein ExbD [Tepidimonas thermarum]